MGCNTDDSRQFWRWKDPIEDASSGLNAFMGNVGCLQETPGQRIELAVELF